MWSMDRQWTAFAFVSVIALSLGACGGATGDDPEVNDANMAQAVTDPATSTDADAGANDDDQDRGDDKAACSEHDGGHHHHHRHHRFHILDGLDGTEDDQITIASLPPSLPPRLIARLHQIDSNSDGIVTKDEAKAWAKAHRPERRFKQH
jgi:hypothetical protein